MKPITFPEQNIVIAKDQPQYLPLPAHKFNDDYGTIVFCISVSKWEAIKLLFTGKLWVQFLTFHGRVTPSFFSATKSDVIIIARPENKFKLALYNGVGYKLKTRKLLYSFLL